MRDGDLPRDRIPDLRGCGYPKTGQIGLSLRPRAASRGPDFFDLVEVLREPWAGQCRRRPWAELRAFAEEEWPHRAPAWVQGGPERRRRWNPIARLRPRSVRSNDRSIGAIAGSHHPDLCGNSLTDRYAVS